ncbi:MAG: hypothetical protein MUF16_01985 [Burkholderiaceae bacterium]|nr:hypothetical protein [Burkholderiaceae bacterium]
MNLAGSGGADVFYDDGPAAPDLPASGDWGSGEGWKPEICPAFDAITGKCSATGYLYQQPITATEEIDCKVMIASAAGASTTTFALGTRPDLA